MTTEREEPDKTSETDRLSTRLRRFQQDIFRKYIYGKILDVGSGGTESLKDYSDTVTNLEINTPGYDGNIFPYANSVFDCVYSSHVIEHVHDPILFLKECFRVCRIGGHIFIAAPHAFLYERSLVIPSRWNEDHRRIITPGILMRMVEAALEPNTYRVRLLQDCDSDYNYGIPPDKHCDGECQIELAMQKIYPPNWKVKQPENQEKFGTVTNIQTKLYKPETIAHGQDQPERNPKSPPTIPNNFPRPEGDFQQS